MIGNTIEFIDLENYHNSNKKTKIGLVVDAFTDISGKSASLFGFGEGKTQSKRIYKVLFYDEYDSSKKFPQFIDIPDWCLKKIISFASQTNQELNEENFNNV
jgi:hypothetical protein